MLTLRTRIAAVAACATLPFAVTSCMNLGDVASVLDNAAGNSSTSAEAAAPATVTVTESPATTTADSTIPGSSGNAVETHWSDLRLGDCLWTGVDEVVETIGVVNCAEPHAAEVYSSFDVTLADFDNAAIADIAETECVERFDAYVGIPYANSIYYVTWLQPTASSWQAGDREVMCILEHPSTAVGSAENSRE